MTDPIATTTYLSEVFGPGRRMYRFIDLVEGQPPVQEPLQKGQCWGVTKAKDSKAFACQNFARSTGSGAYCTCAAHRKWEAAARKLKAELGSNK